MLNTEESCREYVNTHDATEIARQIQLDQDLCQAQKLPSLLSLYLPRSKNSLTIAISKELCPETANYGISIGMAQYSGIIEGIRSYLSLMTPTSWPRKTLAQIEKPPKSDFETALSVLDFCLKDDSISKVHLQTRLEDVVRILRNQAHDSDASQTPVNEESEVRDSKPRVNGTGLEKYCYICRFLLLLPHPQYPSLCKPCGAFNLASSALSFTVNLSLHGKTALVTGGRVNLGYHTALRLLRCGAKVLVSTRYPHDAQTRFLAEYDSSNWTDSLKVIGADFRAASNVFHLVHIIRDQLRAWSQDGGVNLDILINNAAQTLTDSLEKEGSAVRREASLMLECHPNSDTLLLGSSGYLARVRGGVQHISGLTSQSPTTLRSLDSTDRTEYTTSLETTGAPNRGSVEESIVPASHDAISSWMQSIHQIPYEDVISAHSVNTFVPLILIRELLPLMGSRRAHAESSTSKLAPSRPLGYIINVTSREGIFESSPKSSSKMGHHVHTNLTKAALNMLTETESGPAWRDRRVAMNSVDPGYMSAAPEIERKWEKSGRIGCPIGWEDGAGRVLWPIAMGEKGEAVYGRLLKHFGAVEVDVGLGR